MNSILTYGIIFVILLAFELVYFRIADRFNIIDKPNNRSSHSSVVLRGGGIIFALSTLVWCGLQAAHGDWNVIVEHWSFLVGLLLLVGMSFVDDVVSLPDRVRLIGQFAAAGLAFYQLGLLSGEWFEANGMLMGALFILLALIVYVGATNVINFMDGINGITAGYALAVLIPIFLLNTNCHEFTTNYSLIDNGVFFDNSLVICIILAVVVFCLFNFRPKDKAKCFAGDVGSIGIAYILLFMIGCLILKTGDVTYLIFLLVYGVDGCLTIIHRILLHENLGEAHRKHTYQLMANELKIGHVKISLLYMSLQLVISLGFVFLVPDIVLAHWIYLVCALLVLAVAYVAFMKKYYHLHEKYLASIKK